MPIVAKPEEFNTLDLYLKDLGRAYFINRYGETFPPEYPTIAAVGSYVLNGGVFIDYCGYPFYHWNLSNFDRFLASIGADPNYWIGFMPSELPYPIQGKPDEDPFVGYPFPRGWISTMWLGGPNGAIVASFHAPTNVKYNVDYYGTRVNLYVYSVVGVRGGRGWYFYAFGQQDGPSVDPALYASFIRLITYQPSGPGPGPGCNPDACEGTPPLQYGSTGNCVGWVQRRLQELGYSPGSVNCIFDSQTQSAVRQFQADNGLVVDGTVGPQTWAALQAGVQPPPSCPEGTYWDPVSKQCVPYQPSPSCPEGTYWDPSTKQCVPYRKEEGPAFWLVIAGAVGAVMLGGFGVFLLYRVVSVPKGALTRG